MIGLITGIVYKKHNSCILVQLSHGIGYDIFLPNNKILGIELNQKINLFIYHHINSETQQLYGFFTYEEKLLFAELLKINGIGAKMAMLLLGEINIHQLQETVLQQNIAALIKVPGIGNKTARRILVELHDRWHKFTFLQQSEIQNDKKNNIQIQQQISNDNNNLNEACTALIALGYAPQKAQKLLQNIINTNKELYKMATGEIVKLALQQS